MTNDSNTGIDQTGNRPGRLAGKTAVITGGAAGMGRTTSLAFAREGARVAILDIQKEAGEETVQMIRDEGGTAELSRPMCPTRDRWMPPSIGLPKPSGPTTCCSITPAPLP
ncbi:MAG: SDR family NAD(P)-dependent oxidoreductase [Gammaproteobacteria bacterium]|nr:SDR family NAD(P)-dependent oxidoreductase [Gammaproteobacteria bacterium]